MYAILINGELYHHGIKGQRWGVRRYQNKDGTLTSAGKKHDRQENVKQQSQNKKKSRSNKVDLSVKGKTKQQAIKMIKEYQEYEDKRWKELLNKNGYNKVNDLIKKLSADRIKEGYDIDDESTWNTKSDKALTEARKKANEIHEKSLQQLSRDKSERYGRDHFEKMGKVYQYAYSR